MRVSKGASPLSVASCVCGCAVCGPVLLGVVLFVLSAACPSLVGVAASWRGDLLFVPGLLGLPMGPVAMALAWLGLRRGEPKRLVAAAGLGTGMASVVLGMIYLGVALAT